MNAPIDQAIAAYLDSCEASARSLKPAFVRECASRLIRNTLHDNAREAQTKVGRLLREGTLVRRLDRGRETDKPGSRERNEYEAARIGLMDWHGLMMDHAARG